MIATLAAALLLVQPQTTDRYEALAAAVEMPEEEAWASVGEQSKEHSRIVQAYLNRALWRAAFKTIDEKYGLFRNDLKVKLAFVDLEDDAPLARTRSGEEHSVFEVNMSAMVPYQKEIDRFDRAMRGGRSSAVVEPVRHKGTLIHELVHVYQHHSRMKKAPLWFTEGMAAYAEPNEAHVRTFIYQEKKIRSLEQEPTEEGAYGRGWLFWSWVHKRLKRKGAQQVIRRVLDGEDFKTVLEAMMKKEWSEILDLEWRSSSAHGRILRQKLKR